jgi:hypothetical protein
VKTEGAEVTLGGREFQTSEKEREKVWSPWVIVRNGGNESTAAANIPYMEREG